MRRALVLCLLLSLGADAKPSVGTITGSVVAVSGGKIMPRNDVYVYLVDATKRRRRSPLPGAGQKFEIRQVDKRFEPRVLVVPVGAEVAFPNYAREEHNVFSPTDPTFDLGRYTTDKRGRSYRFEDTDEFDIYCDIHSEMAAKVKVIDSAHFAKVVGGKFTIANVPPGRYKVVAWVRNSAEVSEEVVVTAGATTQLSSELHLQLVRRSTCHDRMDGSKYPARYSPCPPED